MTKVIGLWGAGRWSQAVADDPWVARRLGVTVLGPQDGPVPQGAPLVLVLPTPQQEQAVAAHSGPVFAWPGGGQPPSTAKPIDPWAFHEPVTKARTVIQKDFMGAVNQWHGRLCWLGPPPPPQAIHAQALAVVKHLLGLDYRPAGQFGEAAATVMLCKTASPADPVGSLEVVHQPGAPSPLDHFPFTLSLDVTASLGVLRLAGLGAVREQGAALTLDRRQHHHDYTNLEHRFCLAVLRAALAQA